MANIATSNSLQDLLADVLPKDVPFTFYHYSTPPTKSPALFSAPPHLKPQRTFCESQFLAVSIIPEDAASSGKRDELLVLAIEVLIYTTKSLTTIFVSKADSTGYLSKLKLPRSQAGSPLKVICGTFVSWLARERQREGKKLVVSLFARAQDQYLFPASIQNPDKHVLDDRGLVKWWCKVLDPLVKEYAVEAEKKSLTDQLADSKAGAGSNRFSTKTECTAKGHLIIPGFDPYDTLRYVPPPSSGEPRRWATSHPLLQIAPHPGGPPRCLVPHFPDDPKSRYLDELDEELPDRGSDAMTQEGGTPSRSNGMWKSIKTLDQFWEMMAFRQECSSGRIVGFIWVIITPPALSIPEEDENEPSQSFSQSFSQNESQESSAALILRSKRKTNLKRPRRRKVNTETGPIPLIVPRIKSSTSNMSTASNGFIAGSSKLPPESTVYFTWPAHTRGKVLFSARDYNRAHEVLLQQNFASPAAAARSTKRWQDEVAVLGGLDDKNNWSFTVLGKKEITGAANGSGASTVSVNTVVGVRKKRKPDAAKESQDTPEGVTMLAEGLVRKKAKTEADASNAAFAVPTNGVNALAAGLVRKKPKN